MATVLKVEAESDACCVCGNSGDDLFTPEEHDASAPPMQVPLRTILLQLNNNKVVPEGRLCTACVRRALEAHEFSSALSSRSAPPLGEKIRALRRRLHALTQKIDVFIVVGGPAAGAGHAYSEDDIIMVEKDALAAATVADDEDLEHARNAKGDTVYQCSVCPLSFQRVSAYRAHVATHAADAVHSCWTCGAQFAARDALRAHAREHATLHALACHLCGTDFQTQAEMRRHEATCPAVCPACGARCTSRGALSRHAAEKHARGAVPPHVCPACFRTFPAADLLSAHLLRHRQAKQFVCGYGECVLRFATRTSLMAHIRKCHAAELPEEPAETPESTACDQCGRTFASASAMKRHARVHRDHPAGITHTQNANSVATGDMEVEEYTVVEEEAGPEHVYEGEEFDGKVEYLEMETLEEVELEY